MATLLGHATDSPGRWKEPRAFAAADHTAQRAHQGRGRRSIRRRVRGQCPRRHRAAGSLIPHAGAIRALVIAMIETAFQADTMAVAGGPDRAPAGSRPTGRRAVRVAAITRWANRKEAVAEPTDFLAERRVHGPGAAGRSGWTSSPNRGTRDRTASACRSPRQSRGPGGSVRVLTSASSAYAIIDTHNTSEEGVDGGAPVDAQNAPTSRLENPHRTRVSHR